MKKPTQNFPILRNMADYLMGLFNEFPYLICPQAFDREANLS